jgi:hypothetical protein
MGVTETTLNKDGFGVADLHGLWGGGGGGVAYSHPKWPIGLLNWGVFGIS